MIKRPCRRGGGGGGGGGGGRCARVVTAQVIYAAQHKWATVSRSCCRSNRHTVLNLLTSENRCQRSAESCWNVSSQAICAQSLTHQTQSIKHFPFDEKSSMHDSAASSSLHKNKPPLCFSSHANECAADSIKTAAWREAEQAGPTPLCRSCQTKKPEYLCVA